MTSMDVWKTILFFMVFAQMLLELKYLFIINSISEQTVENLDS